MPDLSAADLERFVKHLTECQTWLYAYTFSLVGNREAAEEVLQNTNLAMWQKASQFAPGSDFSAWACAVARFEVLSYRRDRARDRHLFDEETIVGLADRAELHARRTDRRLAAFQQCEEKLRPEQRELLRQRYGLGANPQSVQDMARQRSESPAAVVSALYRIRRALFQCIRRALKEDVL